MRVAVLGTGTVGRTLVLRLAELGHEVTLGTRDPGSTRARPELDPVGHLPLAGFDQAAADAELVVNACNGAATLPMLASVAADHLAGKVLLDLANPLDFSAGFPPTLTVKDTDSLAEQVQRAHPRARVVKALNTVNVDLMVHPESLDGGRHTVFVAGNDAAAKQTVLELLTALGHTDVLDLGDLTAARGTEMYLPLWLRLMGTLGTSHFNVRVVR